MPLYPSYNLFWGEQVVLITQGELYHIRESYKSLDLINPSIILNLFWGEI